MAKHHWKLCKHKCPKCGQNKAELIDTCIIYDKYYICKNSECGHSDFNESKKLTDKENDARQEAIDIRFKLLENLDEEPVKVAFD